MVKLVWVLVLSSELSDGRGGASISAGRGVELLFWLFIAGGRVFVWCNGGWRWGSFERGEREETVLFGWLFTCVGSVLRRQ